MSHETTYVILETHTGAMDGQYFTQDVAEEVRERLEERWEGTSWIILEAPKPERARLNRDRKVSFPSDLLAHHRQGSERLEDFRERHQGPKQAQKPS